MLSEKLLQDAFQRQVEAATGKPVAVWTGAMDDLKRHPGRPSEIVGARQVLLRSDPARGIVGLIDGMMAVNAGAFTRLQQDWQKAVADPERLAGRVPSLEEIALAAALKVAALWETGTSDPEKTGSYRLALIYATDHAWERMRAAFGSDPRLLGPEDLPGWPRALAPVKLRVVHAQEAIAFLDLAPPDWIDKAKLGSAVQAATALVAQAPQNAYAWVREFPVHTPGGRIERADFTTFVHGLPLLWTEMKTPEAGLEEAARDFIQKQTYRGAPLRLLADGTRAALTAQHEGKLDLWHVNRWPIGHGQGMPDTQATGTAGGLAYLLGQVLTRPERLEFLLRRASSFDAQGQFQVARAQQWQALARWYQDLVWSQCAGQPLSDRLIRHTQRTGKTTTMIRAIHLALSNIGGSQTSVFDLSMLMVGEVSIIKQISEAFANNIGAMDTTLSVRLANTREQLRKLIGLQHRAPGSKRVILANTQKLESLEGMDNTRLARLLTETGAGSGRQTPRALIVLDESHLSQHGGVANTRHMILPQAVHLLLTATPKNAMAQYYGITEASQTLDDFGYSQAVEAGMVVPVRFKRAGNTLAIHPDRLEALAAELGDAPDALVDCFDDEDRAWERRVRNGKVKATLERLERDLIPDRLDAIVRELDVIEQALGGGRDGPAFQPRAMVFCRDIRQARAIIQYIQDENRRREGSALPDQALNLYGGRRFGMDVANFGHGDGNTLTRYNPGVANYADIKKRFEGSDPDARIEILLVVGKYTKGYDNANLCMVALLRTIREPSLINQISTRPATSREGKASGVCLDLTLGGGNVAAWRASLALYDSETRVPLFDEAGVAHLHNTVRQHLDMAAEVITPGWRAHDLGVGANLGPAIDRLESAEGTARNRFVVTVDRLCAAIAQLPDAAVLSAFRHPLIGVKFILGHVRSLFPDLDIRPDTGTRAGGEEDFGHDESVLVLSPETLGQRIDRALMTLNAPSLKHFLDVQQLEAQDIQGLTGTSQALQDARTTHQATNTIAAARALLGIRAGSAEQDEDQDASDEGADNPVQALQRALRDALERLVGASDDQSNTLGREARRQRIGASIEAVRGRMQAVRQQLPGGDFVALLTHQIRQELHRRWQLLMLPVNTDTLATFEPLIEAAGRGWGQDFTGWRQRNGAILLGMDVSTLARTWLDAVPGANTHLLHWMADAPAGAAALCAFVKAHPKRAADLRAAMGVNGDAAQTRELPSFLETTAVEAARQLGLIETSMAWEKAGHGH